MPVLSNSMMMRGSSASSSPWGISTTWDTTTGFNKHSSIALTGSNLIATAQGADSVWRSLRSNTTHTSGIWSAEFTITNRGQATGLCALGISSGVVDCSISGLVLVGYSEANGAGYLSSGNKANNASLVAYGAAFTTNDKIGVVFNANTGTVTFYKNGVSQGVAYTLTTGGTYTLMWSGDDQGTDAAVTANFGATAFTYSYP